jgi:hypothetical protein
MGGQVDAQLNGALEIQRDDVLQIRFLAEWFNRRIRNDELEGGGGAKRG